MPRFYELDLLLGSGVEITWIEHTIGIADPIDGVAYVQVDDDGRGYYPGDIVLMCDNTMVLLRHRKFGREVGIYWEGDTMEKDGVLISESDICCLMKGSGIRRRGVRAN